VNGQDSNAEIFDVFLCHNSEDKPAVREISQKLVREGIKPWLDLEQIPPGTSWQRELGEQINSIKSAAVFVGNSGIGPWQNEEIQAFLSQFIERKCPVIPTILGSATTTPELPWTLKNRHRVDFRVSDPDPLKQLIWGITRQKPAARENLIPGKDELATSKRTSFEPRHSPPLAHPPDQDQIGQLEILRRRVMEYWVDGVLKHSLHNEVLLSFGKRAADEFVDAPWKYTVEVSDGLNSTPLENRDVKVIYDATGLLLILGEPGSGKTTTLLDLARALLDRSREDIKERVPIVLNLSSWKKKQPLAEWISDELSEQYRVPRKIARFWLQQNYLLPLLDGLDEVETSTQSDCVAAINAFVEELNPSGLVVCCRLLEYQWLPERLKLNGAISLETLSPEEVSEYLDRGGPKLTALREAVTTDPVLQELAQTPLMLSVMSLACQGAGGGDELTKQRGDSTEERRKQIFGLYVERMFQRKGTNSRAFPRDKTIGWLSWLAREMRDQSLSVFFVEGLQPSWLGTRAQRVGYGTIAGSSLGLIFWALLMIILTVNGPFPNAGLVDAIVMLTFATISVVVGGLVGALTGRNIGLTKENLLNHVTLVETMSWNWNQCWKRAKHGGVPTSLLIIGLVTGLFGVFLSKSESVLMNNLTNMLTVVIVSVLVGGLTGGFTHRVKVGKTFPNEGIKLSRKNALAAFLIASLAAGFIGGLFDGLIGGGLSAGLSLGLLVALIVGLSRGGSAVIKHYALRLVLWRKGYTPFNFIKFLDHCAKLIFLKKVGGGYIFIHRMLLEYFADIPTQQTPVKR
jgi:eukaryotic-like serine/threonine-protein kinase